VQPLRLVLRRECLVALLERLGLVPELVELGLLRDLIDPLLDALGLLVRRLLAPVGPLGRLARLGLTLLVGRAAPGLGPPPGLLALFLGAPTAGLADLGGLLGALIGLGVQLGGALALGPRCGPLA